MKKTDPSEMGGLVCFISHETHPRTPMLKFARDRKNYLQRLRRLKAGQPIKILDYLLSTEKVHLLVKAPALKTISTFMMQLQGTTARDYAKRKAVEGPLWKARYQMSLVQEGIHTLRCILDMALAVIGIPRIVHPAEWPYSGYQELAGSRKRYRITDQKIRLRCLLYDHRFKSLDDFRDCYIDAVEQRLDKQIFNALNLWEKAWAIGSREWIEKIARSIPKGIRTIRQMDTNDEFRTEASWMIIMSRKNKRPFIKELLN